MMLYPKGRPLEEGLRATLATDIENSTHSYQFANSAEWNPAGIFVDLTGDGVDEFLIITYNGGLVYRSTSATWKQVATITHPHVDNDHWAAFLRNVETGNVKPKPRELADLEVDSVRFMVEDACCLSQ
jgi:hypothetical protein